MKDSLDDIDEHREAAEILLLGAETLDALISADDFKKYYHRANAGGLSDREFEILIASENPNECDARMRHWDEEEAAFLDKMRGPRADWRSSVEIVSEGRD